MKHNWYLMLVATVIAVIGLCAGASASSLLSENLGEAAYTCSGHYPGPWGADAAFDGIIGNATAGYYYAWGAWGWVEVDLGATVELTQLDGWTIQVDSSRRTQIYVSNSPIQSGAGPDTLVADLSAPTIVGKSVSYTFDPGTYGRYVQVNAANADWWLDWSEIQVYGNVVPEPSGLIALFVGGAGMLGLLRRKF